MQQSVEAMKFYNVIFVAVDESGEISVDAQICQCASDEDVMLIAEAMESHRQALSGRTFERTQIEIRPLDPSVLETITDEDLQRKIARGRTFDQWWNDKQADLRSKGVQDRSAAERNILDVLHELASFRD